MWKVGGGFTFVLGWEVVQCAVILLQGLAEVVGGKAVLAHLVVDAAQVVQVERGQALARVRQQGTLGSGGKHLHCFAVVHPNVLKVSFEVHGRCGLGGGGMGAGSTDG